jgi:hypothetical protein
MAGVRGSDPDCGHDASYYDMMAVMFEVLVGAIVAVSGVAVLASAAALLGAVLSLGRADHRNPVAYRWIAWHDRRSAFRH